MTKEEVKKEDKKKEKKLSEKDKLKLAQGEIEELKVENLRLLAEFENYRKRKEKELQEARERAIVSFVEDLLPSIDNFEMSLKMSENKDMFVKGVELIHKNLLDILKEKKIESFEPKIGEDFSLAHHEPIINEKLEGEKGKVLAVLRKGYLHKDKVIRSARVNVLKED